VSTASLAQAIYLTRRGSAVQAMGAAHHLPATGAYSSDCDEVLAVKGLDEDQLGVIAEVLM
jgi:hypothetical protein